MTEQDSKYVCLEHDGSLESIEENCRAAAEMVLSNVEFTGDEYALVITVVHRPTGVTACATTHPSVTGTALVMPKKGMQS